MNTGERSASVVPNVVAAPDRSRTIRGMMFMLISITVVTGVNAIGHHLTTEMHPFEISFFRSFISVIVLAPAIMRQGIGRLRTKHLALQAGRAALDGGASLAFFVALSLAPLAKVTALSFSAPLFTAVLAVVIAGEILHWRRIGALIVGFAGALVIMRPEGPEIDWGSVSMLGFAASWGGAMFVTKILARTDSSLTIAFYSAMFITPFAFLIALPFWTMPTVEQLLWLGGIGVLSSIRQVSLAQAFKLADATAILPLDFVKLILAAIVGYFVFAEVPDLATWIGGAMIFGAATFVAVREGQLEKQRSSKRTSE